MDEEILNCRVMGVAFLASSDLDRSQGPEFEAVCKEIPGRDSERAITVMDTISPSGSYRRAAAREGDSSRNVRGNYMRLEETTRSSGCAGRA